MRQIRETPWVEKYKPVKLEDVVTDPNILIKFKEIIETKKLPHLLFCGKAGIGKTTCARIIAESISSDVLYINASDERSIEVIRNKVKGFCSTISFSTNIKIIILDEFDGMTSQAMDSLRNVMEEFIDNCAFILTCNYERKIIEPIKSRCQTFNFQSEDQKTLIVNIIKRCAFILKSEGVTAPNLKDDLIKLVKKYFPDIRRVINMMQKMTVNNQFVYIDTQDESYGLADKLIQYIKEFDIKSIRKDILTQNVDYEGLYAMLFDKSGQISEDKQLHIMMIIGEYEYRHSLAVNPEIQFVTCLINICREIS